MPSPSMSTPPHRAVLVGLVVLTILATACSTAATELARADGSPDDGIPFADSEDRDQPVTGPDLPAGSTTTEVDPAVLGPTFPETGPGPTLTVTGEDGVWWLDAEGAAHLVVEPAVAADYDGAGGLVFQRLGSAPIVRRLADASETALVTAGPDETIRLIGVAPVDGQDRVIFLRSSTDGTVTLERISPDGGESATIGFVGRDGVSPERLSISGAYLTGVYRTGSGSGWVTYSLATGQKLFGTTDTEVGRCTLDLDPACAEAVTVSSDGTTVFQVLPTGGPDDGLVLVTNRAADFAELTRVDLQRPSGGWHATALEVLRDRVVVSRAVNPDNSQTLPALVVDPATGAITQLPYAGRAVPIIG